LRTMKYKIALPIATTLAFVGVSMIISGGPLRLISEQWCLINGTAEEAVGDIERQYGITIHYEDGANAIPDEWRKPPENGTAESITKRNMCRVMPILLRDLRKYPRRVIQDELTDIYLLNSLHFYGIRYGGTALGRAVFMAVGSRHDGFNDVYLSELFHHEMSSVLFMAYPFPNEAWAAVNSKNFAYAKSRDEVLRSIENIDGDDSSGRYYHKGFLSDYGYSTLENDFNLYAEMAFTDPEALKALADTYPKMHQKSVLLKGFYKSISKDFFPEN